MTLLKEEELKFDRAVCKTIARNREANLLPGITFTSALWSYHIFGGLTKRCQKLVLMLACPGERIPLGQHFHGNGVEMVHLSRSRYSEQN